MKLEVFPVSRPSKDAPRTRSKRGTVCPKDVAFGDVFAGKRGELRHGAIDIFAPEGTPVLAPVDGVVMKTSHETGMWRKGGHYVILQTDGYGMYFAHLRDAPVVHRGAEVQAGEILGLVGRTGNARNTCPHVHFEVREGAWSPRSRRINPYAELRRLDPRRAPRVSGTRGAEAVSDGSSSSGSPDTLRFQRGGEA